LRSKYLTQKLWRVRKMVQDDLRLRAGARAKARAIVGEHKTIKNMMIIMN
jgi:hypothetical protein